MLLISGGVSAGKFDLVEPALARKAATFHFTGVRMQPGKPTVFGEVRAAGSRQALALPFFGLPGNPISSAATFLLFAAPVLRGVGGRPRMDPRFALAGLAAYRSHGQAWAHAFSARALRVQLSGGRGFRRWLPCHGTGRAICRRLRDPIAFVVVPEERAAWLKRARRFASFCSEETR